MKQITACSKPPLLLVLLFSSLGMSGCNEEKVKTFPLEKLDPLQYAKRVEQTKTIGHDLFQPYSADCSTDEKLVMSLWRRGLTAMDAAGEPFLAGWGVADVALKDGRGKLVQLRYGFRPGDPEAITVQDDFYLVNEDCNAILWDVAQDV